MPSSKLGRTLTIPTTFCFNIRSPYTIPRLCLILHHSRYLPYPFQFFIHYHPSFEDMFSLSVCDAPARIGTKPLLLRFMDNTYNYTHTYTHTHTHTHLITFLWTSDQLVTEAANYAIQTDENPCLQRDSNIRSQPSTIWTTYTLQHTATGIGFDYVQYKIMTAQLYKWQVKGKVGRVHTMKACRAAEVGMNGHLHALAALCLGGKLPVPIE